ncbi:GNAT family protein [Acutalibacter sp. JLR.KK004]|uniref:GNAT family N-acetyltransferase n=1 Tax=Acutalibacter sp. JLR.KK004 TaxID=3112622 RepID=UPI002FEF19BC
MDWNFTPMTTKAAQAIALWQYEPPYDFYNWEEEDGPDGPLVPGAFVCLDTQGQPMGFFTFEEEGRIPTLEESPYTPGFLDIGLGLRPDLCGKGLGAGFVLAGLAFGRREYGAERFRLSVAAFNRRAIKIYEKCGFAVSQVVTNAAYKDPKFNRFLIMTR